MATTTRRPKKAAPSSAPTRTADRPPSIPSPEPDTEPETTTTAPDSSSSATTSSPGDAPRLDPNSSRSLLVILHGKRAADDLLRDAISELKAQGHKVSVRVTFDRGDVEAFVSEAVRLNDQGTASYQTIVAGGGDGTLNEVACALMAHSDAIQRQGLAVALLPLGTANDFACATGISVDPRAALHVALDPSCIRPIDVASVNGRHFMNIAVAGSVASVSPDELSSKWKRLLGPVAIGFHVLKRVLSPGSLQPHKQATITFCPQPANGISIDGAPTKTLTADLLMLAAGNSRQMGRQVNVCPDALLDDGLLDFTLLSGNSMAGEAAGMLGSLMSGDPNDVLAERGIAQLRASWLEVAASGPGDAIPINRDGEPEEASNRLVFEVHHKALPMHLPDTRMLKQQQGLDSALSNASSIGICGNVSAAGEIIPIALGSLSSAGSAAAEAPAGAVAGNSNGKHSSKKKHGHKKLRKRTLQRMVVIAQPEGREVRARAQMIATSKMLGQWAVLVLLGSGIGFVVRARRERQEQQPAGAVQGKKQKQKKGGASSHHHSRDAPQLAVDVSPVSGSGLVKLLKKL